MPVEIHYPKNRDEWLALRRQDVTASVAAAVLGAHPYATKYGLWAEKTGRVSGEVEETEAMDRGNLLEPVVVTMLSRREPTWTIIYKNDRAYYRDPDRRMGATPDAFVQIPGRPGRGNLQIKTASEDAFKKYWLDPDTGDIVPPAWIAVQAIQEAKLSGCSYAIVAVLVMTWRGNLRLYDTEVPLHEKLWTRLEAEVCTFWSVIEQGKEPDIDWGRDGGTVLEVYSDSCVDKRDLSADVELDTLIGTYKSLKEAAADHTKKADAIKPQIVHALGNSEAGFTAGWEIVARTQERAAYTVAAGTSRPLRIKARNGATAK
ncbi:YqaJ viral recombinase family protein [Mesorhizobium sp.]|uniref:YqaJ viral recombinase family nuclease n=1 Tax=Mesorhizobium sp. TaxID=1871066 RepID=UPI000FE550A3|nr:YqaJ viral recombinase family protein [Mesorhizobium sp.]RWM29451.1 MAG: endonuclease [Mesorhizobium sp.]